jgi:hypothetical protein
VSTSEEELGGVSIYVKLIVWGNDFKAVIDDVLVENGGSGLFVGIVGPTKSQIYSWHRAAWSRGMCLIVVLAFQDKGKGQDRLIIHHFCSRSWMVRRESGELWFFAKVFFQLLKLLLGQGWEWCGLSRFFLGSDNNLSSLQVKDHGSR